MELHAAINNEIAIGMIDILQPDYAQTAADRLRKMELDRLSARDRSRDLFHAIDLFQLALRLRCFAGLGAKSIGKQLQRRDFFLLIFVSGELLFFARRFLLDITVPIAPITHQFRVRDLDDAADKLIQKFAIVRDHDNRARITSQIFLEPLKRFEIEMIRWFVEQKKIGLHHEQPRQMSAHDPAAT